LGDLAPLILTHVSFIIATIVMGVVMRLSVDPREMDSVKRRIEDISARIPPKHMRTTPKLVRKARLLESEVARLKKRYMIMSLKRLTAVFLVYGISLGLIIYKLPYMFESPVRIPLLTFEVEGKYFIPSPYVFLMGVLLLSPIALKIGEYSSD